MTRSSRFVREWAIFSKCTTFTACWQAKPGDTSGARDRDDFVTHSSRILDARPELRDSELGRRGEARQNARRIDEGMRLGDADRRALAAPRPSNTAVAEAGLDWIA